MGLFSFVKSQLLKNIEWTDNSNSTIVYKYPMDGRQIMMGSKLTVRESQKAIFVNKGKLADVFEPGLHTLTTSNLPVLTKLLSWARGFNSPFYSDIYYVNTKQFTNIKWGTSSPITMRDKDFGTIRIRSFGTYAFRVADPVVFLKELFGTNSSFSTDDIASYLKSMLVKFISDTIAESKISALDLAANLVEFSKVAQGHVNQEFEKLGLQLTNLTIESISFPEAVEKAIDTRSSMGVMGDMDTYVKYQAANAMRESANNPNGNNMMGMGVGMGSGMAMSTVISESFKAKPTKDCPSCGASLNEKAKFCPECGHKFVVAGKKQCVHCNAEITARAKFCPECGKSQNVKRVCKKCGAENSGTGKFCAECGEKL